MGAEQQVYKKMFKYSGAFHWRNLVSTIRSWGEERGFDVFETLYKEKVPEIEIEFLGERKRDEYLADYFTIAIHLWAVRDLPEPKGYIEGRGEFLVKGSIETGYKDVYGNRPMREGWLETIDEFFKKHILKMRLEVEFIDPYYNELINLTRTMQHSIGMDMALTRQEEET